MQVHRWSEVASCSGLLAESACRLSILLKFQAQAIVAATMPTAAPAARTEAEATAEGDFITILYSVNFAIFSVPSAFF